jgi:hypothetical protein
MKKNIKNKVNDINMIKKIISLSLVSISILGGINTQATSITNPNFFNLGGLDSNIKSSNKSIALRNIPESTSMKDFNRINCQIQQSEYTQQLQAYISGFDALIVANSTDTSLATKKNELVEALAKVQTHDCQKNTAIARKMQLSYSKLLNNSKNIINKLVKQKPELKSVLDSINATNCQTNIDRQFARWNVNTTQQRKNINGWEKYLERIVKSKAEFIDKSKLETTIKEFKSMKENYFQTQKDTRVVFESRVCGKDQKVDEATKIKLEAITAKANKEYKELLQKVNINKY